METMNYFEPWEEISWDATQTNIELKKEVSNGHVLFKVEAEAIAHRIDCDDVLFKLTNYR